MVWQKILNFRNVFAAGFSIGHIYLRRAPPIIKTNAPRKAYRTNPTYLDKKPKVLGATSSERGHSTEVIT